MQIKKLIPLLLAAAVAAPCASFASGSYTSRPPKPVIKSQKGEKLDSAKYELGKSIYNGKAKLTAGAPATASLQETRLRTLEASLPEKEKKSANLTSYAGKLTTDQLDALEYYVAHRFQK